MVRIVPVHQILLDAARLEELDGCAVLQRVRQGWDAPVGIDVQEPRLLVLDRR